MMLIIILIVASVLGAIVGTVMRICEDKIATRKALKRSRGWR